MLIRTMADVEQEGRLVSISHGKASACRLLLKDDGLNFSVSEARASQVGQSDLWYKNHWEANYVRSGKAILEEVATGQRWDIGPGDLYIVGPLDHHRIIREEPSDTRLISVFSPPITGLETHDAEGAYPASGPLPSREGRMELRRLQDIRDAGRELVVAGGRAISQRYITAADQLGFSFHSVYTKAGGVTDLWYKNHWEANLVLDGEVEVTHRTSGEVHRLGPGCLFLVGPNDPHSVRSLTDVHLISVFDPPLTGTEVHDEDGAFPPTGPVPKGPA